MTVFCIENKLDNSNYTVGEEYELKFGLFNDKKGQLSHNWSVGWITIDPLVISRELEFECAMCKFIILRKDASLQFIKRIENGEFE